MKLDIFFLWYTLIIFTLLWINGFVNHIGNNHYHKKVEIPIYDIIHKNLPPIPQKYHFILDITTASMGIFVMLKGLFHEYMKQILTLLIIRAITTFVTILPEDPILECNKNNKINLTSVFDGCYDKVFSGHTATIFLAYLFIKENGLIQNSLLEIVTFGTILGLVMSRYHHTMDIFLAMIITYLVHHYFKSL